MRRSTPLFNLASGTISRPPWADVGPTALAQRNLLRHIAWGLPLGQQLAQRMKVPVFSSGDLADLSGFQLVSTPPRPCGSTSCAKLR